MTGILYASVAASSGFDILDNAVSSFLQSLDGGPLPEVLWRMQYVYSVADYGKTNHASKNSVILKSLSTDLAFEDAVLDDVKRAYVRVTGESEELFMKFDAREGTGEDE